MELLGNILNLLFNRVLWDAVFPTSVILLFFTFYNVRIFKRNSLFVFISVCFIIFIRLVFGVLFGGGREGGWDCEARRFYIISATLVIFIIAGFPVLVTKTNKLLNRLFKKKFSCKQISILWLLIICIACIGKGLSPQSYKKYVHEPGMYIKANKVAGEKTMFLFENGGNWRKKYYSNADENLVLSRFFHSDQPEKFIINLKKLHKDGYKIYVLVNNREGRFENYFTNKNVTFPLKLAGSWEKGKTTLFEYNSK